MIPWPLPPVFVEGELQAWATALKPHLHKKVRLNEMTHWHTQALAAGCKRSWAQPRPRSINADSDCLSTGSLAIMLITL